ncbi:DUF4148 domain-containing protein [Paraburkholderia caffeinilytica]|uniref:DUF4148 domain-containing protein n=1 Tax=Paraburkholderia caffeinilytica TaxID=1761016 RepID=A0ABQ1LP40_9BURK|nr:DUF4148 domain-containing protein [Paraburkholderia caffeinilytica]GGC26589.1 hypothetical protein GCM10011400_11230 [Paraburkholderia caffeinilytica]CAB3779764.1 hypothetical protein LMG28690_00805 [Paraburkholderia caffeinilytica]
MNKILTVTLTVALVTATAPLMAQVEIQVPSRQQVRDELVNLERHGYSPQSYYWRESLAAAEHQIEEENRQRQKDLAITSVRK